MLRSGDDCPQPGCPGTMDVYASRQREDHQTRYLACSHCGRKDKQILSADAIRRRRRRVLN